MSQDHRTAELARTWEVKDMGERPPTGQSRFELSIPKIIAGALAAAGAAVASSWLGVAGTVLGAVVGSVIVPVGTALASRPIERSSQVIRESLPPLPLRTDRERGWTSHEPATTRSSLNAPQPASRSAVQPHTGASQTVARRPIRWGVVVLSCLLTLVVGFGLITVAEEAMGRTFASLIHGGHGGTTLSHVVHGGGGGSTTPKTTAPTTTTPTSGEQTTAPTTPETTAPTTEPTTTAPETTAPTTEAPTTGQTTGGASGGATDGATDAAPSDAALTAPTG